LNLTLLKNVFEMSQVRNICWNFQKITCSQTRCTNTDFNKLYCCRL